MAKQRLNDDNIRVLKKALRTKLGVSVKPAKKAAKKPEVEDDDHEPAPRKTKTERLGYAEI